MFNSKKSAKILSIIMGATILFTGCNSSKSNEDNSSSDNSDVSDVSMGRFVQTDISPEGLGSGSVTSLNQNSKGEILFNYRPYEDGGPSAFVYSNEEWIEKDNTLVKKFIEENKPANTSLAFSDFDDNWWTTARESGNIRISVLSKDGVTTEIEVPYIDDAVKNGVEIMTNDCQFDESGTVIISLFSITGSGESMEIKSTWLIFDNKTKTLVNTITPNFFAEAPVLSGQTIYGFEEDTNQIHAFDIKTGESKPSTMPESFSDNSYTVDENSEIVFATGTGIHQTTLNSNTAQTIVDNKGFAFADPQVSFFKMMPDKANDTYYLACSIGDDMKVYKYSIDKSLPTNQSEKLHIWALEDTDVIRAACAVFAQENLDCEIILEFGKSNDTSALTHDDIVRNLNTRLLAGEAPDILFLDGLSYDTLVNNSLLSEINVDINKDDFYPNILSSYSVDDKIYAYPTFFKVPVFVGETASDFAKDNSLKNIAELYKDGNTIFNDSYQDIFEAFLCAEYYSIFPDNKTVNEEKLKEFLTYTNSIIDSQNITSEDGQYGSGFSNGVIEVMLPGRSSLVKFYSSETSYGTGILDSMSNASAPFMHVGEIGIEPLTGGNYICNNIASIPTNAKNKEMANVFIDILLNSDRVQKGGSLYGFAMKKSNEIARIDELLAQKDLYPDEDFTYMELAQKFDWEGLMSKLNKPMDSDKTLYNIIYEQAVKLYEDDIDVDTAHAEIMKTLNILLAERQ